MALLQGTRHSDRRLVGGSEAEPGRQLAYTRHPLARAIVAAARDRGSVPAASEFRSLTGRGVIATVDERDIAVGGPALLRERGLALPSDRRRGLQFRSGLSRHDRDQRVWRRRGRGPRR